MFDESLIPLVSVALGALSTGTKAKCLVPSVAAYEIVAVTLTPATVAPVGSDAKFDVEIDAVSVFTTIPSYVDGATAVTGAVVNAAAAKAAASSTVTVDVDQVGSGTAGTAGTLTVWARKR